MRATFPNNNLSLAQSLSLSLILSLSLTSSGCRREAPKPAPTPVIPASAKAVVQVATTDAMQRSISDTANITGALGALNDVVVGIKNAGKLIGVFAREGDHVHAGQVVAQQDTTDLNSQIVQARGNWRSAQSRLDQATVAFASAQTNLKLTDATTKSAVEQAMASLKSAQDSLVLP